MPGAELVSVVLCDERGSYLTSSVGYSVRLDKRNDPIIPTRGYYVDLSQDVAGFGGTVHYVRTECGRRLVPRLQQGLHLQPDRLAAATSTAGTATRSASTTASIEGGDTFRRLPARRHRPARHPVRRRAGRQALSASARSSRPSRTYLPEQYGIKTALISDIGTLGSAGPRRQVRSADQPAAHHRPRRPRPAGLGRHQRLLEVAARAAAVRHRRADRQRALRQDPGLPLLHLNKVLENSPMNDSHPARRRRRRRRNPRRSPRASPGADPPRRRGPAAAGAAARHGPAIPGLCVFSAGPDRRPVEGRPGRRSRA